MQDAFSNMEALLGVDRVNRLARARIAVFGVGGVGSYVAETLARCGVGSLTLVDNGSIRENGIGSQPDALRSTIGKSKVQVLKDRIFDIDQNILVHTYESAFNTDTASMFDLTSFDYIIDATGDVPNKLLLIERAKASRTPILSCMGVAGRLDPLKFEITDISKTRVCPVAKVVRTELRKKGLRKVKVLFSKERPRMQETSAKTREETAVPLDGTIAYMPGIAGMLIAREVVKDLLTGRQSTNH